MDVEDIVDDFRGESMSGTGSSWDDRTALDGRSVLPGSVPLLRDLISGRIPR
ncbi:hypothetical protein SAMN06272735_8876 [Streptomyces sp. TLI_55]|uniref:hypothetical protein n=1 Tax=Streptomyces sp. TLI_55 TaxID=1938861 RepID=UPI000BD26AF9|nr:hypothetical protein [Streptomyces sp. TLI_55]SNX88427.1 hypothetical protein SAMN06272735_8876 [Streptomyces sp. TLI_55]